MSTSSSPTPTPAAGPSSARTLESGDEKNRCVRIPALDVSSDLHYAMCGSVVIKVGMVGDSQIGKTSLMVKYVEGSFDEDYIQTLGTFTFKDVPQA